MKGGAIRIQQKRKDKGMKKAYGKGAMNHATWRMSYSKISGEEPSLEVQKHSR